MPELETSLYSVSLLNDDETPMEFVVHVLEVFLRYGLGNGKAKNASNSPPRNRRVWVLFLRAGEEKGFRRRRVCA